jgi:hypothetical protein
MNQPFLHLHSISASNSSNLYNNNDPNTIQQRQRHLFQSIVEYKQRQELQQQRQQQQQQQPLDQTIHGAQMNQPARPHLPDIREEETNEKYLEEPECHQRSQGKQHKIKFAPTPLPQQRHSEPEYDKKTVLVRSGLYYIFLAVCRCCGVNTS